MTIFSMSLEIAKKARFASYKAASLSSETRNEILKCLKESLSIRKSRILEANEKDLKAAESAGKVGPLLKRLKLDEKKFEDLLEGIGQVIELDDPTGIVSLRTKVSEGLILERVSCPIGVLTIVYEARPEAGVQIASLAIKSGNALILKGGKEASHSNEAVYDAFVAALEGANLKSSEEVPLDFIQLVETREEINQLLSCTDHIDLVIPRGSNALIKYVQGDSRRMSAMDARTFALYQSTQKFRYWVTQTAFVQYMLTSLLKTSIRL